MRRFAVSACCVLLVAGAAAQSPGSGPTFSVGTATAARGKVAYGELQVPAGSDAALAMPVAVIHGAKPGKVVAFVAGAHGTEYASSVALTRLIARIDPALLSGTVIVAPLLNVASFERMTPHINPVDGKRMNSLYPGDRNGTQTDRALALVTQQIVEPADVIVDLHGGDLDEDLRPYSYWTRTGNAAQDAAAKTLVMAFGLDHIILRDIDVANAASIRSLGGYALSKGKTAIVAEAGRSGVSSPADVNALISGSLNVLGSLKMLARPVVPVAAPVYVTLAANSGVAADKSGMFFATALRDTIVKEGAIVGYTTDFLGRKTGDVKAAVGGLITYIRGVPTMVNGATLVTVCPVLTTVAPYKKPS